MTSNVESTLETLGLKATSVRGSEIQLNCPAHKERTGHEDSNPSLWINADSGAFICFSCRWKGNIHTLVNYLGGYTDAVVTESTVLRLMALLRSLTQDKPKEEAPIIHESMLSAFSLVPEQACKARGILPKIAEEYGVRWNQLQGNWVIPVRHPGDNKLMGWQEKGHQTRFFKNTTGLKKSVTVFGYSQYKGGDMIVVESPLDVTRLASVGIPGGVATFGCAISDIQFNLVRGADKLIFAMDNDKAGNESTLDLYNRAKEIGLSCWFFNYSQTDQKDIGGMSKSEIQWGLQNAIHILEWRP